MSVDPELMMRMLIISYCMGIRFERRLCHEVHLNFAYRWLCRLGLDGKAPDWSAADFASQIDQVNIAVMNCVGKAISSAESGWIL